MQRNVACFLLYFLLYFSQISALGTECPFFPQSLRIDSYSIDLYRDWIRERTWCSFGVVRFLLMWILPQLFQGSQLLYHFRCCLNSYVILVVHICLWNWCFRFFRVFYGCCDCFLYFSWFLLLSSHCPVCLFGCFWPTHPHPRSYFLLTNLLSQPLDAHHFFLILDYIMLIIYLLSIAERTFSANVPFLSFSKTSKMNKTIM